MARIMAIDYGLRRTGIAVTDPLQIIATGLTTVESPKLIAFLKEYFKTETVELILIGEPKNWDDSDTHGTQPAREAMARLKKDSRRSRFSRWTNDLLRSWPRGRWWRWA